VSSTAVAEAFERAPLLVERLAGDGGGRVEPGDRVDAEKVVARARSILAAMGDDERIAVLNAHPRVGEAAGLSARSAAEQRADDATDAGTLAELKALNEAYERKFGFRFVVFVRGRSRAEIVPVLKQRLERRREDELATGIEEFLAIARDRLARA